MKRTPEEILRSIEESSVDDEIERVLAMSPAERDAELVAAGYDLKALDAQADALRPKPPVVQAAHRFRPRAVFLLAAAMSALVSVAVSIPTALLVARAVVESAPRAPAQAEPAPPTAAPPPAPAPSEVATLRHEDVAPPSPLRFDAGPRDFDTKMPPKPPRKPKP